MELHESNGFFSSSSSKTCVCMCFVCVLFSVTCSCNFQTNSFGHNFIFPKGIFRFHTEKQQQQQSAHIHDGITYCFNINTMIYNQRIRNSFSTFGWFLLLTVTKPKKKRKEKKTTREIPLLVNETFIYCLIY